MWGWLTGLFGGGERGKTARAKVADGATLLDVRTEAEHRGGALEGSVNIPVQALATRVGELPKGPVVVYCRSGARSAKAAGILRSAGFDDVFDLGGKGNW